MTALAEDHTRELHRTADELRSRPMDVGRAALSQLGRAGAPCHCPWRIRARGIIDDPAGSLGSRVRGRSPGSWIVTPGGNADGAVVRAALWQLAGALALPRLAVSGQAVEPATAPALSGGSVAEPAG